MTNLIDKLTKSELKLIQKLGLQSDLELVLKEFAQQKTELELQELESKLLAKSQTKNTILDEKSNLNLKNQKINQKELKIPIENQEKLQIKLENLKLEKQNKIRKVFLDKVLDNSHKPQVHTFPTIINQNTTSQTEHEATTSQISQEILAYLQTRGLDPEKAKMLIVGGFCGDILTRLPMEFALEARKLVELTLENGFG